MKNEHNELSPADIDILKNKLLEKRFEILGSVLSIEHDALKREDSDLSKLPFHMGDMGSDAYEIENSLSLAENERKMLREIDEALERIQDGTYGRCLGTGKSINKARLMAIPWTKFSIEFASKLEQGLVSLDDIDDLDDDDEQPDATAA